MPSTNGVVVPSWLIRKGKTAIYCTKHNTGPLDIWYDCQQCMYDYPDAPGPLCNIRNNQDREPTPEERKARNDFLDGLPTRCYKVATILRKIPKADAERYIQREINIEQRRRERGDDSSDSEARPVSTPQIPRAAGTKRPRAPRTSEAEQMATSAEQLWSAKTRGLIEFQPIAPTNGLSMGAAGVAAGSKGSAAFFSYLKHKKVIERLEAEGFERAGPGALHPWYLRLAPGVVSPHEKALARALTDRQRAMVEANRVAALKRLSQHNVAALHGELSDNTMIAAIADQGAPIAQA